MAEESLFQRVRFAQVNPLPTAIADCTCVAPVPSNSTASEAASQLFPHITGQRKVVFRPSPQHKAHTPKRVGVVFSGGQAAGGHNVITGLHHALTQLHPQSRLFGFLNGPSGILQQKFIELTESLIAPYHNMGGFDLLGSGRTKIETVEQFAAAQKTLQALALDALVVIGGDDSNTNAALLAEYLCAQKVPCAVIGAPKTIDGDLRSDDIEMSFGFDTACKVFSETIGSIARDALSAKKYYHFIRLMGRSASHVTLECALQTHPNMAFITEEIAAKQLSLQNIVDQLADVVCQRAAQDKLYGIFLIPEGILEFIPESRQLISELNQSLAKGVTDVDQLSAVLSPRARACFLAMPPSIRAQLLLDRDPHGNVQVSKIESERLLIEAVQAELAKRAGAGAFSAKFNAQAHFLGYEGRSCFPSAFDANYCYTLGHACALLADASLTGYVAYVKGLSRPVSDWEVGGVPIASLIRLEERKGQMKPVIHRVLVDLQSAPFERFAQDRISWAIEDLYRFPGPMQFFGPIELVNSIPLSLAASAPSFC